MNRLLMSAVADVSHRVRQTVLSALIETEDLDTYLAQAEWYSLLTFLSRMNTVQARLFKTLLV